MGLALRSLLHGLVLVIVAGCGAGDYQFYVVNASDDTWVIRAMNQRGEYEGRYSTAIVKPGADGVGVAWLGEMNNPVELLDPDCVLIGTFAAGATGTYQVAAAPGITGRVTPYGADREKTNTPEITRTPYSVGPNEPCLR